MPSEVGAGQLSCSIEEQKISSYKRFDEIVHQIYKEPDQAIPLLDRFVGEMGASDPLYPLAEKVRLVGQSILRGETVDHLLFLYPGKVTGSFFAGKASFEGNELSLTSLEEEVRNSEFNENLEVTVRILGEALACLEDYKQEPDFSFLDLSDPVAVHWLFEVVDYFGLDEFQEKHLEPFNKKFPGIPLSQIPRAAKSLYFSQRAEITPDRFREISSTIRKIIIAGVDVRGFDFSHLQDLEELEFCLESSVTTEQIKQLSSTVRKVILWGIDVGDIDFSYLKGLEVLILCRALNVTAEQIGQLSYPLKTLDLSGVDVAGFNFSHLTGLEELDLSEARNVTAEQIRQFSPTLKKLYLGGIDVTGFDFSHLALYEDNR